MPLYEYHCAPCDRQFEALVRADGPTPPCPECGHPEPSKLFSVPAAAHVGGSSRSGLPICNGDAGPAFGPCGAGGCGMGTCGLDN